MVTGKNWFNFLYISVLFIFLTLGIYYYGKIVEIRENWPIYRCNPIYMPLADDMNENFTYCIQTMQSSYMSYLLDPLKFVMTTLGSTITELVSQTDAARNMIGNLRFDIPNIFTSLFGSFSTLTIEFQKISIGIRDMLGKMTGVMVSVMYIMDGSIKTMKSGFNFVSKIGKCFHPNTLVQLKNGDIKLMRNLELGEILKNGSRVESVMKINNKNNAIPFYMIKGAGVEGDNIYVTGSHYVYDEETKQFIQIEKYSKAKLANHVQSDWFSCLITSDHKISIGNELFWDWDDYLLHIQ
jgi:hypothetical protein